VRSLSLSSGYALAGWVFCALVAVVTPADLHGAPLHLPIRIRTDSLGAGFFCVLALSTFFRRRMETSSGFRDAHGRPNLVSFGYSPAVIAALGTVRDLGALVGVYVAANFFSHPDTMRLGVTHFARWPTEQQLGVGGFLASMAASIALALGSRPHSGGR